MTTPQALLRRKSRRAQRSPRGGAPGSLPTPSLSPLMGPGERRLVYFAYPLAILWTLFWCAVRPLADPDCWTHMAFGRILLEQGRFPAGDVFSFTAAGREWISSGWAASVALELVHRAAGPAGLVYFTFVLLAAAYLAVYFCAVRHFSNRGSAALVLMACALGSCQRFNPRPELFSQLFLAATALLLVTSMRSLTAGLPRMPKRLWFLPALFALWANFHAGFPAGLAAVTLCAMWLLTHWKSAEARVWLLAALACLLCWASWLLNPYGMRFALLGSKIKQLPGLYAIAQEWMAMFGATGPNLPWPELAGLGGLFCLWLWTAARQRKEVQLWQSAMVFAFAGLALNELRHAALAALVISIVVIQQLRLADLFLARWRAALPLLAAAFAVSISALQYQGALGAGKGLPSARLDSARLPENAAWFAGANRLPANMYNSLSAGGFLLYHLGPQTKVFMDGRCDVYDTRVWQDHLAIQDGVMTLEEAAGRYGLNSFFVDLRHNPDNPLNLASRLTAHAGWALVYFDDDYAIFVRKSPETAPYLETREFKHVTPFAPERLRRAIRQADQRKAAQEEVARALHLSAGSAKANLLGAYAWRLAGNEEAARRCLDAARRRDREATIGLPVE